MANDVKKFRFVRCHSGYLLSLVLCEADGKAGYYSDYRQDSSFVRNLNDFCASDLFADIRGYAPDVAQAIPDAVTAQQC